MEVREYRILRITYDGNNSVRCTVKTERRDCYSYTHQIALISLARAVPCCCVGIPASFIREGR